MEGDSVAATTAERKGSSCWKAVALRWPRPRSATAPWARDGAPKRRGHPDGLEDIDLWRSAGLERAERGVQAMGQGEELALDLLGALLEAA